MAGKKRRRNIPLYVWLSPEEQQAIIDFEDRRQVADISLSQVHATADRVSFEWKIGFLTPSALFNGVFTIIKRCYILGLPQIIFRDYLTIPLSKSQAP